MNSKLTIEDIKSILEREDNYYDFKEEYHQSKNNKELLKDILSLANCKHNGNRYIFFGIAEKKGKFVIKGILYNCSILPSMPFIVSSMLLNTPSFM